MVIAPLMEAHDATLADNVPWHERATSRDQRLRNAGIFHFAALMRQRLIEVIRSVRSLWAVAAAARNGSLRVDEELHLSAPLGYDEGLEVIKLRARLDARIGEVQLPEVILAVDAQVRFNLAVLGREPRQRKPDYDATVSIDTGRFRSAGSFPFF